MDVVGQPDEVGRPDAADMEEGHGEARLAQGTFSKGVSSVFSNLVSESRDEYRVTHSHILSF